MKALPIYFVLVSTLVSSCLNNVGCKKVSISRNELDWFTNHINKKVVFFKSSTNEIDTFLIEVEREPTYSSCNKFELGEYVFPCITLRFDCQDNYKVATSRKRFLLEFYKSIEDIDSINCQKGMSFFELDVTNFYDFNSFPKIKIKDPRSNDSIITYKFRLGKQARNPEGIYHMMSEFTISKKYGLMSYQRIDSVRYERVW